MEYALEMKNICKSFPGVRVLDDVSLAVKPGEVHALMGENGAGKSTLMKILMGIYTADSGTVVLNGNEVRIHGPKDAMNKGISMIHQELSTLQDLDVTENIFVGRELLKKGGERLGLIDKERMCTETQNYFDEMHIDISPREIMRNLSTAQKQLVEIVKAISENAKIVIMDEPTSSITEAEAVILFEQVARLKKQGVSIIYITHKMDEVFQIADRVTVLRDGACIGTANASEMDENTLIKMMVGREIRDIYPKEETRIGDVVLQVKDLSWGRMVKNVSFELHAGEVLGFAGLVGAGRSETAETIFGIHHKKTGEILLNGKPVEIRQPADAIRHRIAFVTEDRKLSGLNLAGTVKENISLVSLEQLSDHGIIRKNEEREKAERYISELKIKTPSADAKVSNLSGGNQQKVVLAKWLLSDPDIIIFDEPTRGIDVGAKRDIYLLVNELAKKGKAVIVISSEMPEVMGICDRLIVMCEGQKTGELVRTEFSQETIMSFASKTGGKAS